MVKKYFKAKKRKDFEDYAWVLDYLPYGHPDDPRPIHERKPIAQAIGEKQFVLMELVLKDDTEVELAERVYIGRGKRDKVDYVARMIKYDDLTNTAKTELLYVVMEAVKNNEERFINFLNKCQSITPKKHMLELLPEIGKKHMWQIIEEREKKPFESFKDFEERTHKDIVRVIAKRIVKELEEDQKYYLFVKWKRGLILNEEKMTFYLKE
ncbi:DUF655 domain-containing protein [Methanotorris igneus]|uniref:DUF655 domain-containing protein n=1 Tax=Methanotorris igneus (strain DSM 5666 / JCM 11834 / Kol 5) TaxID=880724 RepID=F6BCJ1_METIK|nr:DUF655 domain-containing protein [Methanotorris igneus]AEF96202.1 protein of unknown function DUF655 [Methanotorris igneus Kol 5]